MIATILQSRTACSVLVVAAVVGGLFVWHTVDKTSAVRRAVVGYVADVELHSARAELDELKRRRAVAESARRRLQEKFEIADAEAEAARKDRDRYVSTIDHSCVVGPELLKRLRNR